jgi:hypothetical protein
MYNKVFFLILRQHHHKVLAHIYGGAGTNITSAETELGKPREFVFGQVEPTAPGEAQGTQTVSGRAQQNRNTI